MNKKSNKIIALALTGLFAGGLMVPQAIAGEHVDGDAEAHADKASCKGENSCKSKGSCKAEDKDKDSCSGKDGCNGKDE